MKEHPILFSGEMVRAILEGRKTQTRRPFKPQPPAGLNWEDPCEDASGWSVYENAPPDVMRRFPLRCPFGVPGDQLWVRETFARGNPMRNGTPSPRVAYRATMTCGAWGGRQFVPHGFVVDGRTVHRHPEFARGDSHGLGLFGGKWKPSIHMPRGASRINLEVIRVWPERVQDISLRDLRAEGVLSDVDHEKCLATFGGAQFMRDFWRDFWRARWDAIYAKSAPFDENGLVWAVEFAVQGSP